jgi:hypothetical protein
MTRETRFQKPVGAEKGNDSANGSFVTQLRAAPPPSDRAFGTGANDPRSCARLAVAYFKAVSSDSTVHNATRSGSNPNKSARASSPMKITRGHP